MSKSSHFVHSGIAAATLFFASASCASAQDAVWSCAGKQVLRLHATVSGKSPQKRVEALDERVTNLLSKHSVVTAADIVIKRERGLVYITAFGDVLVTIAPDDATANNTTRERLAHTWLTNLRGTLPQLSPRVNKRGA